MDESRRVSVNRGPFSLWGLQHLKRAGVVVLCSSTAGEVTCHFVPDELGGLNVAHAAEQAAQLVLTHALRQVVHNQVGPGVLILHHLLAITIIVQLLQSHAFTFMTSSTSTHLQLPKCIATNIKYTQSLSQSDGSSHLSSGGSFGSMLTVSDIILRRLNLTHLKPHTHFTTHAGSEINTHQASKSG